MLWNSRPSDRFRSLAKSRGHREMRIAQVAPLYESCPPQLYGGTERVVSYLTEELVRRGHEVTLFASGDSRTEAVLQAPCERALRLNPECKDPLPYHFISLHRLARTAAAFDVIHFHTDYLHFPLFAQHRGKTLTTLHGRLDLPDLPPLMREFAMMPLVSNFERAAHADAVGKLVRHSLSRIADEPLCPGMGRWRLSRLYRPNLPRETPGFGNRDRAARRAAVDDRGKGRQSRSCLLQDQDQAATQRSADRVHRRNRR